MIPARLVIRVSVFAFVFAAGFAATGHAQGVIAELLVHGNHTTPDADVLRLSGLAPGAIATDEALAAAARTLRSSGRFADVDVRRRFRSIDDPSAVLVIVVVNEHPAVSDQDLTPGWGARTLDAAMWLPILNYADGYGFTYGARASFIGVAGRRSRMSVPLTWGAERRAAIEIERSLDRPALLVRGGASFQRHINPFYDLPDLRRQVQIEIERAWTSWFRTGGGARLAEADFGPAYDARHTAAGVYAVVDTRVDPSFPRNAVHARAGWERLDVGDGSAGRWSADIRSYAGIGRSVVLAVRGQLVQATSPLPAAEQSLVGGASSIRGYRAGYRAGDSIAALSAELRLPFNSPLRVGRFGLKAFVDAGTAWRSGARLRNQQFDRGAGGGLYVGAGPLVANVDIAWSEQGKARGHVGLGVAF